MVLLEVTVTTKGETGQSSQEELADTDLSFSAFGQLLSMLDSLVIKRSSLLTDKLLRLLSGIPGTSRCLEEAG